MGDVKKAVDHIVAQDWQTYNLQEDLFIDKHSLDLEALKQPMLQAKWNSVLAASQLERDKAQQQFKVKEAELTTRGFGGESPKVTGEAVKAWVRSHTEYDVAYSNYNEAEGAVSHLWGARQAIEAKKNMIETAVRLWGSGYFSTPKITPKAREKVQAKTSAEIKKATSKTLPKRKVNRRPTKK